MENVTGKLPGEITIDDTVGDRMGGSKTISMISAEHKLARKRARTRIVKRVVEIHYKASKRIRAAKIIYQKKQEDQLKNIKDDFKVFMSDIQADKELPPKLLLEMHSKRLLDAQRLYRSLDYKKVVKGQPLTVIESDNYNTLKEEIESLDAKIEKLKTKVANQIAAKEKNITTEQAKSLVDVEAIKAKAIEDYKKAEANKPVKKPAPLPGTPAAAMAAKRAAKKAGEAKVVVKSNAEIDKLPEGPKVEIPKAEPKKAEVKDNKPQA